MGQQRSSGEVHVSTYGLPLAGAVKGTCRRRTTCGMPSLCGAWPPPKANGGRRALLERGWGFQMPNIRHKFSEPKYVTGPGNVTANPGGEVQHTQKEPAEGEGVQGTARDPNLQSTFVQPARPFLLQAPLTHSTFRTLEVQVGPAGVPARTFQNRLCYKTLHAGMQVDQECMACD